MSMHFKQSILGLSLQLAAEIAICTFGEEKSGLPRGPFEF